MSSKISGYINPIKPFNSSDEEIASPVEIEAMDKLDQKSSFDSVKDDNKVNQSESDDNVYETDEITIGGYTDEIERKICLFLDSNLIELVIPGA